MLTNGASTTTKMPATDHGGYIPATYRELIQVSSKDKVKTLPPHRLFDLVINLEPSYNLPYRRMYNLSVIELSVFKADIQANLANGCIQG